MRQAAFLRGINVGTGNRVAMADLARVVTEAGYTDVSTLLNSGNVALTASGTPAETAATLENAVSDGLGLGVRVAVRSAAELDAVAEACPWPELQADGSKLFVGFLLAEPGPVEVEDVTPERWQVVGREVWQHSPAGISAGRLWKKSWDVRLGVDATLRNWNTLQKVRARLG